MCWTHKWVEQSRVYHRPPTEAMKVTGYALVQQLMYGMTFILLKCEKCGDFTSRELLGNHVKEAK